MTERINLDGAAKGAAEKTKTVETHPIIEIDDISKLKIISNYVLCVKPYDNKETTTDAGIYVVSDSLNQDQYLINNVDRVYRVVKTPDVLVPDLWKTEMELCPNDLIWIKPREAAYCLKIITKSEVYYLISYYEINLTKRNNEIIPVNGLVVCSFIKEKIKSSLDWDKGNRYIDKGIVEYVSKTNILNKVKKGKYKDRGVSVKVKKGDEVLLGRISPILLEGEKIRRLGNDDLFITHRKNILAVLC